MSEDLDDTEESVLAGYVLLIFFGGITLYHLLEAVWIYIAPPLLLGLFIYTFFLIRE